MSPSAIILPQSMSVHAVALQFRDLHKIRAPVGCCEGFDITAFDKLIEVSELCIYFCEFWQFFFSKTAL